LTNSSKLEQFYIDIARSGFIELIVPFDKQYEKCFEYKLLGVTKIKDRDVYILEVMGKEASTGEKIPAKAEGTANSEAVTEVEVSLIKKEGDAEKGKTHRAISYDMQSWAEAKQSWDIKFGGLALIDARTMELFQFNCKRVDMEIINSEYHEENAKYEKRPAQFPNGPGFTISNGKRFVLVMPDGRISYDGDLFNAHSFLVQTEYGKVKIKDQFLTLPMARTIGVYKRRIDLETFKFTDVADWHETYTTNYSGYKAFTVDTKIHFGVPIDESPDQKQSETN